MDDHTTEPGPLAPEKRSPTAPGGSVEPDAAEVESARLLANEARTDLRSRGIDDDEIRRLADEYVALDVGGDSDAFVTWALDRSGPRGPER